MIWKKTSHCLIIKLVTKTIFLGFKLVPNISETASFPSLLDWTLFSEPPLASASGGFFEQYLHLFVRVNEGLINL